MSKIDGSSFDQAVLFEHIRRAGRFEPIRKVGTGGMADVVLAYDKRLRVERALKAIKPGLMEDKRIVDRFLSEAHAMAAIEHVNIVRVFDIIDCVDAGKMLFHYIVLEWCGGGSLDDHIDRTGGMPSRQAVTVLLSLMSGLKEAHAQGIYHRDIKPDNVLITTSGVPKLADFGIARIELDPSPRQTMMGVGFGSYGYMPPEQYEDAARVNAAYDIHALAVTLWHMISGQRPLVDPRRPLDWYDEFQTNDSLMMSIPSDLVPILRHATRIKNTDRHQTLEAFKNDLAFVFERLPPDPPEVIPLGGGPSEVLGTENLESLPRASQAPSTRPAQEEPFRVQTLHEGNGHVSQVDFLQEEPPRSHFKKFAMIAVALLVIAVPVAIIALRDNEPDVKDTSVSFGVAVPSSQEFVQVPVSAVPTTVAPEPVRTNVSAPPSAPSIDAGTPEPKKPAVPASKPVKVKDPGKNVEPLVTGIASPVVIIHPPSEPPPSPNVRVGLTVPAGDGAQVWVQGASGKIRLPASIPPGTYKVLAQFDRGELMTVIPALIVTSGSSMTLRCDSDYANCRH